MSLYSRIVEYILAAYFIIFQLPKLLGWIFFTKYTDDSFYPREETHKSGVDYL